MSTRATNTREETGIKRAGAGDSANVRAWGKKFAENGWWHSFELPDGRKISGVNSIESMRRRIGLFPIPEDLHGKRVLDIGAWDGWFSFEMERRGAEVVSVDCVDSRNFRTLHRELGSKIEYRIMDMYELSPARLGTFDIVLFLGVLYHLKHPLLALEKVCALTRDIAAVQTFVSPETGSPVMEFFEIDELGGQFDNWCAPNPACVQAMARTAGFARAEVLDVNQFSAATIVCFRRFSEPPKTAEPPKFAEPAPELAGCVHMTNFGINFRSDLDEYASAWFKSGVADLHRGDVQASVGPYHSGAVALSQDDAGLWQINFKIPPGLDPGWNQIRVRTANSPWSNPLRIAIDLPLSVDSLLITGASDGQTWTAGEVGSAPGSLLSIWVSGLPENRDLRNVQVLVGPHVLETDFIQAWMPDQPLQVNARLPEGVPPGRYPLTVACGGVTSAPFEIACR